MNNDLISRSALLKCLQRVVEKCESLSDLAQLMVVHNTINEQPTAYKVDKVVEQLEKVSEYYECENAPNGTDCQMILLEQAKYIVKAGGMIGTD